MRYYKVENHITNEFAIIEETIYKQEIELCLEQLYGILSFSGYRLQEMSK